MKKLILVMCILLLGGCVASQKIVIPDVPVPQQMMYYNTDSGVFIDMENTKILQKNILDLKAYADKLRELLEMQNEGK